MLRDYDPDDDSTFDRVQRVKNRLAQQIAIASEDYKMHKDQVDSLLRQGDDSNKNSLAKQNETVSMRQK